MGKKGQDIEIAAEGKKDRGQGNNGEVRLRLDAILLRLFAPVVPLSDYSVTVAAKFACFSC